MIKKDYNKNAAIVIGFTKPIGCNWGCKAQFHQTYEIATFQILCVLNVSSEIKYSLNTEYLCPITLRYLKMIDGTRIYVKQRMNLPVQVKKHKKNLWTANF